MLVLIDESGDPGFKLVRGSSSHFVIAMVVFDDFAEAERTSAAIGTLRQQLALKAEFKFSKCHDDIKDAFFDCVRGCRFSVRALVVDKSAIYSENLRERIEREDKHWKYNPGDIEDRMLWNEFQEAYEIALKRTSTDVAPWYCVPSDDKDYCRTVVKTLLLKALRELDLEWPEPDFDPEAELKRLEES